jgi:hypothetical protein
MGSDQKLALNWAFVWISATDQDELRDVRPDKVGMD